MLTNQIRCSPSSWICWPIRFEPGRCTQTCQTCLEKETILKSWSHPFLTNGWDKKGVGLTIAHHCTVMLPKFGYFAHSKARHKLRMLRILRLSNILRLPHSLKLPHILRLPQRMRPSRLRLHQRLRLPHRLNLPHRYILLYKMRHSNGLLRLINVLRQSHMAFVN